jgi:hypothetical protein
MMKRMKLMLIMLLMVIATITTITAINSYWTALADPVHCDQLGWPSCYSDINYSNII